MQVWAEASHRQVAYALCNDRRTLLWFANQRAVEYHPTLMRAGQLGQPRVPGAGPRSARRAAGRRRGRLRPGGARRAGSAGGAGRAGLASAVKTSGAKGVHVFVPLAPGQTSEHAAAATRAIAARAEQLEPELATTAFIRDDRGGKVFIDATRAGGATVVAAYSPRVRPGTPVSFPVSWDDIDKVQPRDFTVRNAAGLLAGQDRWAALLPDPQQLPADLVEEGHQIPIARVQAMHEGKRRARARREQGPDRPGNGAGREHAD